MKLPTTSQIHQSPWYPFVAKTSCFHHYSALAGVALGLLWYSAVQADLSDYQTSVTSEASLISYYTFDLSDAEDVYGVNNGTLTDTTAFAAGVGGAGTALSLDGDGRVNLGVVEDFAFADRTGSVEAWVQAGALGGAACLFANRDGQSRWDVHLEQNKSAIGMWNGSAYFPTVPIPNASTNWHHLVVVFDDGPFKVYWDGELAGETFRILGFTDDTKSTQIGSISPTGNNSENWVGLLDEVAFYADALTPTAVQAHYQAFFIGDPPSITKQPEGGTYVEGVALTLSVDATGPELSYQWYKGVNALAGQTTNTLFFSSLVAGDVGAYSVIVSNTTAAVASSNAVIELASLPAPLVNYQSAVSSEASLISYYTFDDLTPDDVAGLNDGALAGTAGWGVGIGGSSAQGLLLDGAGHVDLGAVFDFDFATGVGTVEGWIRADWVPNSAGYWPCMYANRDGDTVWSLHLSDSKNTPSFYNGSASSWFVIPGGAGANWHHVATVFTNGTASFYVDGNLIQYSPMARTLGTGFGTVQLGSSAPDSTSEGWIGMLDEVAFYSTALPPASIQAHYDAFVAGAPPVITSQPVGGNYLVEQLGQLSVAASGGQLVYQWYKDDVLLPGFTNAIIGPMNLPKDFSGSYHVTVANGAGSTNSTTAIVYVDNDIASYQSTVLAETNLISYYTFDAGDAQDAMNAHPGSVANAVAYETGPGGVTNLSLSLDGTGHIDLGQVADFNFADGTGTIEGWIQAGWTNPASYDPTLFANRDTNGSVWSVHMSQWKTEVGNFSSGYLTLPIASDGNWHHYAIVFDDNTVSMYWDGKPRGSFSQTLNSVLETTTQIGSAGPVTTADGWVGSLDEVAFYSTALGEETIWNHFLAMTGAPDLPALSYSLTGTQLTLSWPTGVTGFTLESAETLTATSWTPVDGVVNNQATVDASVGTRFYRLKK